MYGGGSSVSCYYCVRDGLFQKVSTTCHVICHDSDNHGLRPLRYFHYTVMWYTTGYGIALGSDSYETSGNNGFIGTDGFLLTTGAFRGSGDDVGVNWAGWLFQWAFAATTATSE